jgi:hypothetical protein
VRGVKLEVIRIDGTTYTSVQALQRFAGHLGPPDEQGVTDPHHVAEVRKRIDSSRCA